MTTMTREAALRLASQQRQAGQLASAESIYRAILAQNPNDPEALYGLSALAHHAGHPDALALIERSVAIRPDVAETQLNYGNLLQNAGRLPEAINAFRRAMALDPTMGEAYNSIGSAMQALGRADDAVAAYEVAVRLRPQSAPMMSNLGNGYFEAGQIEKSLECHRRAVALDPNFSEAHNNLVVALQELGEFEPAIDSARTAIALKPGYAEAHQNLGMLLLMKGDYAGGWPEYEWRWKRADGIGVRALPAPAWDGSAGNGTILIHAEQGFGDTIQFARYLPSVKKLGWRVILECVARQEELLSDSASGLGIDQVIARAPSPSGPPPAPVGVSYDVQLPMMSLPLALRDFEPDSPSLASPPYLEVNSRRCERWRGDPRLKEVSGLKVGLVWAGRPQHRADRKRSMPLSVMKPLAMEGVTLFSLQPGPTSPAWGSASGRDVPMPIVDLAGDLVDFSDTAAVLGEMDLVITVDTAVAHLAGALDRPTWLLLSHVADFRWLRDRTDTPWYPSMRLYRQSTRGDWAGVIARVAHDLSERTGSCAGHRPLESVHVDDSEADSSKGSLPEVPCPQ